MIVVEICLAALTLFALASDNFGSATSVQQHQFDQDVKIATELTTEKIYQQTAATLATTTTTLPTTTIRTRASSRKSQACSYEKGPWQECRANGTQRRTLKLKQQQHQQQSNSSTATSPQLLTSCEQVKIVSRSCQLVGCKYVRGEWSPQCANDGFRQRVDTLVGKVGASSDVLAAVQCDATRVVRKKCRRACHYIKTAWSECRDGLKTRRLTLDEHPREKSTALPPAPANDSSELTPRTTQPQCAKLKVVKRPCNATTTSADSPLRQQTKTPNPQTKTKTSAAASSDNTKQKLQKEKLKDNQMATKAPNENAKKQQSKANKTTTTKKPPTDTTPTKSTAAG